MMEEIKRYYKLLIAIEQIEEETGANSPDIIDSLVGLCWNEEEAFTLKDIEGYDYYV